jgi:aspartate 1-decarboxylase
MLISVLRSKLHRACITDKSPDYQGSLAVDERLLHAVGMRPFERIVVANIATGSRFETYIIPAPAESGTIALNGAAARLGEIGDRIIVMSFALAEPEEEVTPRIAVLDEKNRIITLSPSPEETGSGPSRR